MSELRIESWSMPGADLGPENPLPPLHPTREPHKIRETSGVPEDMLNNIGYGHIPNPLPYTLQDQYNRQLEQRAFKVAVLENEWLRATFLLELGGRLWSLVSKPTGRELLHVNPVFQPANLAIRNAWFSGGVEWNIGTIGHCVFTCSPLFAARVQGEDGTPILRMYEWERIRQTPFQIDAYLPDGSRVLYVRVRITNPHGHTTPTYWWSNMAVPETPDTRVLVPADSAYSFSYSGNGLERVPIPILDRRDVTYTATGPRATDYFFHIPDGQRPWITALDREGKGLIQTSTARLKGRKLFLWGQGPGGKRWQAFLARPGHAYLEIQAGLARTQAEHLRVPPGATWEWLEAYGLMEADAVAVHGSDWSSAQRAVDEQLGSLIPREILDDELEQGRAWVDRPPVELVQRGSGWGALERLRRERAGEPPFCSEGLIFDDASLGPQQAPWQILLTTGVLPKEDPDAEPVSYVVQAEWRALLEQAVQDGQDADWATWLHLGLMHYQAGERDAARRAWERSITHAVTPWALRNLANLAQKENHPIDAARLYTQACRMRPDLLPLAIECGRALIDANRPQEWLTLLAELAPSVRGTGRVRLLEGQAALAVQDFVRVERLFADAPVIEDLREGELSLSQLWFEYHAQRVSAQENIPIDEALRAHVRREHPVPPEIDFRMHAESI